MFTNLVYITLEVDMVAVEPGIYIPLEVIVIKNGGELRYESKMIF
jgi:hypothetical protein